MAFREDLQATQAGLVEIGAAVNDIDGDVTRLQARILELENSPDRVTPADQAIITDLVSMVADLKTKTQALNERTPTPEPPPAEPTA